MNSSSFPLGISINPSGFTCSVAILAIILLFAIEMVEVIPSSFFILSFISFAMFKVLPKRRIEPDTSRYASSSEAISMSGV